MTLRIPDWMGVGRQGLILGVLGVVVLQAVPGVLAATTHQDDWSKDPSPSQPPSATFGVVWPLLYLCIAASCFLVATSPASPERTAILMLLGIGIALNWAWIPTWGGGHRKAAMFIVLAMLASLLPTMVLCTGSARHRAAAALLGPYAAWLIFALLLSSERNTMDTAADTA